MEPTQIDYRYPIGLFERVGVELEYMIVDAETLDVRPVCDRLLAMVEGASSAHPGDAEPDGPGGVVSWSNELALHVLEMKTPAPVASLAEPLPVFNDHVRRADEMLASLGARLMPGAMHPWMDPHHEMVIWPHEYGAVYEAFDRIFGCTGHGWANLQSTHINLPFADDAEFGRLHAAIRLALPLLPALAASSPMRDGRLSGFADTRLEVYRTNSRAVPSVAGMVIPERVFTRGAYESGLLAGIYRDIRPHDPEGLLQYEWLNARGCIARFMRGAIEIRVLDIQERPLADLAMCELITRFVRALCEERWSDLACQQAFEPEPLHATLLRTIRDGERATIDDGAYLEALGLGRAPMTAQEAWRRITSELAPNASPWNAALAVILDEGTLSTRLRSALGESPSRDRMRAVYRHLCDCLHDDRPFRAGDV
ncbi:MAG: glutamate-cysteine ligase family protein [Phycisphaerales bacterium]